MKKEVQAEKHHINKNVLAILLILAILISLLGTFMAISNTNKAPVDESKSTGTGMVGVYVINPDIIEEGEDERNS